MGTCVVRVKMFWYCHAERHMMDEILAWSIGGMLGYLSRLILP
jgi:hypothetical protein